MYSDHFKHKINIKYTEIKENPFIWKYQKRKESAMKTIKCAMIKLSRKARKINSDKG